MKFHRENYERKEGGEEPRLSSIEGGKRKKKEKEEERRKGREKREKRKGGSESMWSEERFYGSSERG